MATPVGGLYAYAIQALHDSAYDLPEDFFERVESALDAETRAHFADGLRTAKRIARVRGRGWAGLVAGIVLLIASGLTALALPEAFILIAILGLGCVVLALLLYAYSFGLYLAHREQILGFLSFVSATRHSSLGRDLA